jgi:dienelactone hydrolase
MKYIWIFLSLAVLNFAMAALGQGTSAPQSQPSQQAAPTIASTVDREIGYIEERIVQAAEAMPEDKFNFSPESLHIPGSDYAGVRTFASQVKHVAASNYFLYSAAMGEKPRPEDFNDGKGPENLKTKAEILQFLKNSFALGHKAAAALTTENMLQAAGRSSRVYWATFGAAHAFDHYGQMAEYLRMNGIVPPASASQAKESQPRPAGRVVDLRASDGTVLKASYFAAAKPGPGVLLLHQVNRTRDSWDDLAGQLAAAGINTLTLDMRGFGESGGTREDKLTAEERAQVRKRRPGDIDTALQYLASQPGVKRDGIGMGGAGGFGVDVSVDTARRHSTEVKSLVLLSGETLQDGLQFLRKASQLPELFAVADDDEYPPTVEAMELLYVTSSSPSKKFVHYSGAEEAPWLWYEPVDVGKVPANGGHGTDMLKVHPEFPGIIVNWFVTTLIKTPGHAPVDTLASAAILNQIRMPGGVAQVTQQLMEAQQKDPKAQLFPEITVSIIGQDHLRVGEAKLALEVFKLNLLAYPESADANDDLADGYLADGQIDLARQHAEKVLALLDSHTAPASSWSDTEPRRGEIRRDAQQVLKKVGEK